MSEALESWHSAEYAAAWAGEDVIANLLELPRRLSTAIVADAGIEVGHVIDVGSGPGVYLERFLRAFPGACGTWTDSSEAMLDLAMERLGAYGDRVAYELVDAERLDEAPLEPAEVIVSSRVLHHFSPESLARVYRAVHGLLVPGGLFFNLDHVGAPGDWEQAYRRVRDQITGPRKQRLAPHRHDYPLPPTEAHLGWARDAGFADPDAPWRTLYTALILARR
ncbi:MAG TPA: class I SAM-dependent methyltransferase [Gaiellaceae bacterium]|nr:class I SAM-dependent methyltransferase [Gaiellaceae bacterium]